MYILNTLLLCTPCVPFLSYDVTLHNNNFPVGQTKDSIATVSHIRGRKELRAVLHAGTFSHTYMRIHIHAHTYVCTHTHTYMYTYNTYMCVYTH